MKVLSLFDGISCGKLALDKANIFVEKYVASEIDEDAIKVSKVNNPEIIHVGDVRNLTFKNGDFDLIIAGSPCQGFSRAGARQYFEDSRSSLYFEFLRILKEVNPKYFLLENVKMKKEFIEKINEDLKVTGTMINSSLLSAQNRERYYWTNIEFEIPVDLDIKLSEIIGEYKGISVYPRGCNKGGLKGYNNKSPCVTSSSWEQNFKIHRNDDTIEKFTPEHIEQLQTVPVGYTSCLPKSKRSKVLGNGWTVDVIAHILSGINKNQ